VIVIEQDPGVVERAQQDAPGVSFVLGDACEPWVLDKADTYPPQINGVARTLARRFNNRYGDTFTVPTGVSPAFAGRIMDLAEPPAKMSKSSRSGAGVLYLLDPPDVLRRKINRAITDNRGEVRHDPTHQPGVSNLLEILAACTGRPPGELATEMRSYAAVKAAVDAGAEEPKQPAAARRDGLESSRVGWAAHHSLGLLVDTLKAYTGTGTSMNSHSSENSSASRSASALIPNVSVA
jgi:hypothetical protein